MVILVLQDRGGCSLLGWVLCLILDGTCCFILSSNLWVVRPKTCDSAIGQHLLENPDCAKTIMATCFGLLVKPDCRST